MQPPVQPDSLIPYRDILGLTIVNFKSLSRGTGKCFSISSECELSELSELWGAMNRKNRERILCPRLEFWSGTRNSGREVCEDGATAPTPTQRRYEKHCKPRRRAGSSKRSFIPRDPFPKCHAPRSRTLPRYQATISVRFGPRLAGAKLALLSLLGSTNGATNRERLLVRDSHNCILRALGGRKLFNFDLGPVELES